MKFFFHNPFIYKESKVLLIMKMTLILLTICILQAEAKGTAQTVTIDVVNVPLKKVYKTIEHQTGYFFVYTKNLNDSNILITLKVDQANINETLQKLFFGLPLTYQLVNKVIVINNIDKNIDEKTPAEQPNIAISGLVLSEQGQPLGGASITNSITKKIVLTNVKGEFTLSGISANTELIITYIGYTKQKVFVKDASFLRIKLAVANNELDAMVIKGYYNTSNRLNTGNVTTIKGEDINKQPVTDLLQALEAKVPGLYISQASGIPGANSTVHLRGMNSIPIGKLVTVNDPLYIIDGVPYSSQSLTSQYIPPTVFNAETSNTGPGNGISPFNSINTADIERVEVLKDADATAIYGSRGANGVILITTKKGRIGKTQVDVNVYTAASKITRELNLLNTKQYLDMRREAFRNGNTVPDPNVDFDLKYWDTTRYTDWQKFLIGNPAHLTNAQVSVSGGNPNTQFILGGGYSDQGTVFPGNYSDKKASVHLSVSHTSDNQRFRVQATASYVNDINKMPLGDFTANITLAPDAPALYDKNGDLNWQLLGGTATWYNPLAATRAKVSAITDNIIGNLNLSYQVFKNVQIRSSFGYTHTQMNQSQINPASAVAPPYNTASNNRLLSYATNDIKTWIIEPQINFQKQIGKINLEALAGTTFQENVTTANGFYARGYSSDALIPNPSAAATVSLGGYDYTQYKYNAVFTRLSLNWEEKYLLNLTGRRDGSSRFGPARQFGNFGAIGAGWIFSKEAFSEEVLPWLSFGKLRASYGITGNDQLTDYQYLSTYNVYNSTYQGGSGLRPTSLTNPYFAWERDKKLEGGIELGFFQDRIMFMISYYRNRTDNQLVGYPLPAITGFNTVQSNLPALIQNKGLELSFNTLNWHTNNFEWRSALNLSIPRNKLVAFPGIENTGYATIYGVGKSLSSIYAYHYIGVNPQTGIYAFATQQGTGNPQYGIDDVFSKPVTQNYYGGVQNTFRYKGVQLDVLVQFVKQLGYNYFNSTYTYPGAQPNNVLSELYLNRWQRPGDKKGVQQLSSNLGTLYFSMANLKASDGVISDASFVRLKNVTLSYQFPRTWNKKTSISAASVYLECQNLFTITNYLGLDPETQSFGLPPLRTIAGGIKISF